MGGERRLATQLGNLVAKHFKPFNIHLNSQTKALSENLGEVWAIVEGWLRLAAGAYRDDWSDAAGVPRL